MIYIRNLSSDEEILLLLKELLNHNTEICKLILKNKKINENLENKLYYSNRYENSKRTLLYAKKYTGNFHIFMIVIYTY